MNTTTLLLGVAALWMFTRDEGATKPAKKLKTPREEANRIVSEANDIVDGKRDAFSDDASTQQADVIDAEAADALTRAALDASVQANADAELRKVAEQAVAKADSAVVPTIDTSTATPKKPAKKKPASVPELDAVLVTDEDAPSPDSQQSSAPNAGPTPAQSTIPAGFDPEGDRRMAPSIANNLKKGRDAYDRRLLRDFQTKAGLQPDKIYGGATRGALIFYGIANPPQPYYKPTNTIPYTPPA